MQNAKLRAVIRRPMTKTTSLRKSAPTCTVITRSYPRTSQSSTKPNTKSSNSMNSLNRRTTSNILNPSYMNDSSLIELRDRLYDNPDFENIDDDTIQKLQAHLREYKQDRALCEDYDNAEKASYLLELVKTQISKRSSDSSIQKNLDSISNGYERKDSKTDDDNINDNNNDLVNDDQKKRLNEFEEKWKNKFEKFDKTTEQRTNELDEKQSKQLEEFEKVWSTEKPQKYRKPSSKLLELKKIERTLALSGEFDKARSIHSEAEQLAAKEQKELQAALIRDYRSAKESFLSKQRQEKQKFLQTRLEARSTMEIQKDSEYNKFVKRTAVVQDKYKDAQRAARERSGQIKPDYGVSVSNFNQNKVKFNENIIPPLFAPNDPSFVEEDERKTREKKKKQLELQKKNAEVTLLEYTVQPSPRENEEEEKINNSNDLMNQNKKEEKNDNSNDLINQNKKDEKIDDVLKPVFVANENENNKNNDNDFVVNEEKYNNNDLDPVIKTTNDNQNGTLNLIFSSISNNNNNNDINDNNDVNEINLNDSDENETQKEGNLEGLTSVFGSILNNSNDIS